MIRRRTTAALLAVLGCIAGCGGPSPRHPSLAASPPESTPDPATGTPTPAAPTAPAGPEHVVVAIFENKSYRQIKGNPDAPYLNALLARSLTFTTARAVTHPSQPNYLALFSGSTQGVTDDSCLAPFSGRPNLARQLLDAGHTFTGYSEDLPRPGYRGCRQGRYAAKHNPWVNFDNVPAAVNQPLTAWPNDLSHLPTVAFVVPNLCSDMHDCGVGTGDTWARTHLDPYLRWADTHRSRLIVTFDENDGSLADDPQGNQILTLIAGAGVTPGGRTERIDHYTVLRTIEGWYGLPPIGNAAGATPIAGLGPP